VKNAAIATKEIVNITINAVLLSFVLNNIPLAAVALEYGSCPKLTPHASNLSLASV
jgi:hypothetical protein